MYLFICVWILICLFSHLFIYIYIYIYIHVFVVVRGLAPEGPPEVDSILKPPPSSVRENDTPNPPTKSLDFRGFDSSKLLILRDGNSHVR